MDINYAPVADVNTNPENPIIGCRAFGSDPAAAAIFVRRCLEGLHAAGCLGCLKHFPGHGDTKTDSHTGYAESTKTWEELLKCEMLPFREGIRAGADLIMTAHIALPNVTGSDVPSTLSRMILTEKLRGELGFDGVIITDALATDIVLMPLHYQQAFHGVVRAVEEGRLTEERIDASVARVQKLRERKKHLQSI